MDQRLTLFLKGRVQGVFFRVKTKELADRLGLVGYVENLADGRVKIVAEGKKQQLEKLADWARQGPKLARVNDQKVDLKPATGRYEEFVINY